MASSCQGEFSKDFWIFIHGLDLWFNLTEGWKYNSSGSIYCWWLKTGSQQLGFVIPLSTTGFSTTYEFRNSQMAFFPHCNFGVSNFFSSNEFGASFEALNEGLEMIFPSWIVFISRLQKSAFLHRAYIWSPTSLFQKISDQAGVFFLIYSSKASMGGIFVCLHLLGSLLGYI